MKFFVWPISLALFSILACNARKAETIATPPTQTKILTDTFNLTFYKSIAAINAPVSYALYKPKSNKPLPILFLFDPHGDGALPVNQYQKIADSLQIILVGNHQSKNGMDAAAINIIWQQWYSDVKQRIKFDTNSVYVAGFSGGAKAASVAAQSNQVKGLICMGAAPFNPSSLGDNLNYIGITGNGDLNYTDLLLTDSIAKAQKHQLIIFNGKHEWCPATVLTDAVSVLLIWNNGDSILKSNYTKSQLNQIEKHKNNKHYMEAETGYRALISVDENPTYNNALAELKNTASYKSQLTESKSILINEQNKKQHYAEMMQQGIDTGYWTNEVMQLHKSIENEMQMASNHRLLSFLSLLAYTLSNKALAQNNIAAAQYFTNCYNTVDTSNAEANFLKAIVAARLGNNNLAIQQLNEAKQKGFTNWNRINAEPALINLNWHE